MPPIFPAPSTAKRLCERGLLIGRVFLGRSPLRSIADPTRSGFGAPAESIGLLRPDIGVPSEEPGARELSRALLENVSGGAGLRRLDCRGSAMQSTRRAWLAPYRFRR